MFGDITWEPTPINYAQITYHADTDTLLNYDWNFNYNDDNPFGIGVLIIDNHQGIYEYLGNGYGSGGPFVGSNVFNLEANQDYIFLTEIYSVVSGAIWTLDGSLSGQVNFNFTPTPVPEPTIIVLLGSGLIGLFGLRKKD